MTKAAETVAFTSMAEGSREDYELLERLEERFAEGTADRVLAQLRGLGGSLSGYRIDRLEHSLQSATRAHRDGADEEMVVAALLHDIGDLLSPSNHSELAAAVLRPTSRRGPTGSFGITGCSRVTTTPTIGAETATPATPIAIIPGTRTPWTSATAGTSVPSTPTTNRYPLNSSSRWCDASSRGSRSARRIGRLSRYAFRGNASFSSSLLFQAGCGVSRPERGTYSDGSMNRYLWT